MRLVALVIVVAIIYLLASRQATHTSSDVKDSIDMVDQNLPQKPATSPGAPTASAPAASPAGASTQSGYLRAMDRTRAVVGEVHRQQKENANN